MSKARTESSPAWKKVLENLKDLSSKDLPVTIRLDNEKEHDQIKDHLQQLCQLKNIHQRNAMELSNHNRGEKWEIKIKRQTLLEAIVESQIESSGEKRKREPEKSLNQENKKARKTSKLSRNQEETEEECDDGNKSRIGELSNGEYSKQQDPQKSLLEMVPELSREFKEAREIIEKQEEEIKALERENKNLKKENRELEQKINPKKIGLSSSANQISTFGALGSKRRKTSAGKTSNKGNGDKMREKPHNSQPN